MRSRPNFTPLAFAMSVFVCIGSLSAAPLFFEDGFENIAVGDYPDENGWVPLAIENMDAKVSADRSFGGEKSFCFAPSLTFDDEGNPVESGSRIDYVRIPVVAEVGVPVSWRCRVWLGPATIDAAILVTDCNEIESEEYEDPGGLVWGLCEGCTYSEAFYFDSGGGLWFAGPGEGGSGPSCTEEAELGEWQTGKWYDVEVRTKTEHEDQWRNLAIFVNGEEVIPEHTTYGPKQRRYIYLMATCLYTAEDDDVVFFDGIKVYQNIEGLPDLTMELNPIPNEPVLEGEPLWILGKVKNIGNQAADDVRVNLYQVPSFASPEPGISSLRLNKDNNPDTYFDYIGPGKSKNFFFRWNAVEILNNEHKEIEVWVDDPSSGPNVEESNESNNLFHLTFNKDLLLHEQSYRALTDGFSFSNWGYTPDELFDLRRQLKIYLSNAGAGPLTNIILAAIYPISARGGHCYGMASTSILYSTDRLPMPSNDMAFNLLKEQVAPDIAVNHVKQMPSKLKKAIAAWTGEWPTLQESFGLIKNAVSNNEPVMLLFDCPGPEGSVEGSHAVVAYNVYEESQDIKYVVLYDNGFPGMGTTVKFDLKNNEAVYPQYEYDRPYHHVFHVSCEFPYLNEGEIITSLVELIKKYIDAMMESLFSNQQRLLLFQSPVHVTIIDPNGNTVTDKNGGLNQIPGAFFEVDELTHIKKFYLPSDVKYEVDIEGYDSGNCIFSMVSSTDGAECILSETDFDVSEDTMVHCTLLPGSVSYALEIDRDGDGIIDATASSESHEYKIWDYKFIDEMSRTELRINLTLKQLQFQTKEKDYYPIYNPHIYVKKLRDFDVTRICYYDSDIFLLTIIVEHRTRIRCFTVLFDKILRKIYLLESENLVY